MSRTHRRNRIGASFLAAAATLAAIPAAGFASVLFTSNYGSTPLPAPIYTTPTGAVANWTGSQAPTKWATTAPKAVDGTQTRRLFLTANPWPNAVEPSANVLGVEIYQGDITDTGANQRARAEVLNQSASASATDGQARWYSFSVRLAPGFNSVTTTETNRWTKLTQWKGGAETDPPLALQVANGQFELARRVNSPGSSTPTCTGDYCYMKLGPARTDEWTRLKIGVYWSSTANGMICVIIDGHSVANGLDGKPGTSDDAGNCTPGNLQTLQTIGSSTTPDPIYLKQGIYQNDTWNSVSDQNHKAWFGPTKIGQTVEDVGF